MITKLDVHPLTELRDFLNAPVVPDRIPDHLASNFVRLCSLVMKFAETGVDIDEFGDDKKDPVQGDLSEAGYWMDRQALWINIDDFEAEPTAYGWLTPLTLPITEVPKIYGPASRQAETMSQLGKDVDSCVMQYSIDRHNPCQPRLLSTWPRAVAGSDDELRGFRPVVYL